MRYCQYLILLVILVPFTMTAQPVSSSGRDITGLWKGTLYNDTTKQFYWYEIAITQEKGKLSGYSHTWFLLGDKRYYGLKKVKVKKSKDGKIIIEDNGLISNNYPVEPAKNVRQLNVLTLYGTEDNISLEGPFSTNQTKEYNSLTGNISLKRQEDYWQTDLLPHLQELGLEKKLSFVHNDYLANILAPNEISYPSDRIAQRVPDIPTIPEIKKAGDTNTKKITKEDNEINTSPQSVKASQTDLVIKDDKKSIASVQDKTTIKDKDKNLLASNKKMEQKNIASVGQKERTAKDQNDKGQKEANKTITVDRQKSVVKNQEQIKTSVIPGNIILSDRKTAALEVSSRNNIVQQTLFFSSDSLQLSLFDNGEVDGDTVSVLMNGNLIIAKQGLSTNAFRKTIYINQADDSIQLIMYAENLGSIPPNTGLLVVRDGKGIYEIRFRGDLQKNASIILRRKR